MAGAPYQPGLAQPASRAEFLDDVLDGLSRTPRSLPGKYLWDENGSLVFDRICESRGYYLTRRETALLSAAAREVGQAVGAGASLVEFGSGASVKSRILLFKDGRVVRDEDRSARQEFYVMERGVYRVEVYLPQLGPLVEGKPWIISNPIYVR